jgi:hypothetical protein
VRGVVARVVLQGSRIYQCDSTKAAHETVLDALEDLCCQAGISTARRNILRRRGPSQTEECVVAVEVLQSSEGWSLCPQSTNP